MPRKEEFLVVQAFLSMIHKQLSETDTASPIYKVIRAWGSILEQDFIKAQA